MSEIQRNACKAAFWAAAVCISLGLGAAQLPAQEITLGEGTAVSLVLSKDVSSKDSKRGDAVSFTVDEDVAVDGQTVIKKGTPAVGSIIYAEKGGYMGKSGKLALQVESTKTVDDQMIPLLAAKGSEGNAKTGTFLVLSNIIGPFAIFQKGDDTTIKEGAKVTVYTGELRKFAVNEGVLSAMKTEAAPAAGGEKATVYIYRPKKLVGGALEPSVFCDDVDLARMDNGRYFMLKLDAGKHVIHMTKEEKGYELTMAAGRTYYFRIGIEAGMWKGNGKILLEDEVKGAEEVKKLKPLGADKIKDKSVMVTN